MLIAPSWPWSWQRLHRLLNKILMDYFSPKLNYSRTPLYRRNHHSSKRVGLIYHSVTFSYNSGEDHLQTVRDGREGLMSILMLFYQILYQIKKIKIFYFQFIKAKYKFFCFSFGFRKIWTLHNMPFGRRRRKLLQFYTHTCMYKCTYISTSELMRREVVGPFVGL